MKGGTKEKREKWVSKVKEVKGVFKEILEVRVLLEFQEEMELLVYKEVRGQLVILV